MHQYLRVDPTIDWQHPRVLEQAAALSEHHTTVSAIAQSCFEWVRDEIRHSVDYQLNPVTCRASDVLRYRTGYCYAKSHLLAALLRANNIPTGFCYQRLSVNDQGPPYCLHGLNAVYLPEMGWYRLDARGNRAGVDAQFTPPQEQLAFNPQSAEEVDFPAILPDPLEVVIETLQNYSMWDEVLVNLPDVNLQAAKMHGLIHSHRKT